MEFNGLLAESRSDGIHLYIPGFPGAFHVFQLFIPVKPCLLFGPSALRSPLHPFQLRPQKTPAFALRGQLHLFSLCL